jgi:Cu-Zn family superoxide dismutase
MHTILIAALLAQADAGLVAAPAASTEVKLIDAGNKPVGTAKLTQTEHGVLISVDLHDLKPGVHAIHIHETAKCEPPAFKTAGGHDNPAHKKHGFMTAEGPHAGDLPNLDVPASGSVKAELIARDETLEGPDGLFAGDGSALVIHAKADDYKSQPAGDAGDRVACGVIQK